MSKRKYENIDYEEDRVIYRTNKHFRKESRGFEMKPMDEKVTTKKNSFHVDNLLAEKTAKRENCNDRELSSPQRSAFQRISERRAVYYDKCTKPCCIPSPEPVFNLSKYPSRISSYRSRESGSADSVGSSCNSYEYPVEHDRYLKRTEYTPDRHFYKEYKELQFPYEYKRLEFPFYPKNAVRDGLTETCACADCNQSKVVQRSPFNDPHLVRHPTKVLYIKPEERDREVERKPLSKRKSLLNELEQRETRELCERNSYDVKVKIENDIGIDEKELFEEQMTKGDELLKLPAGANRNRAVANLLERRRVAELNSAFERLRTLIPCYGNEDRALSKIKTLKYAFTYMSHLMTVLREQSLMGSFHIERDFKKLSLHDPLIQKCRDHMCHRKIF